VLDLVAHLNQTQRLTTLLVMHDLNLAVRYCQRLLLLDRGRLLADGAPGEVITEEHLRSVYGTDVAVHRHGLAGRPFVSLLPRTPVAAVRPGALAVHVIGGAGTAASLIESLAARGSAVSAGVLNVGDSDHVVVERLGLERAEEAPFSPISQEAAAENRRLIGCASIVVVAPAPFGPANLDNLRAAREALWAGRRVIMISQPSIETRDFCDGAAAALYSELLDNGAVDAPSAERALALIAQWEQSSDG
jgi:iron complex transport system ATP-binding protein